MTRLDSGSPGAVIGFVTLPSAATACAALPIANASEVRLVGWDNASVPVVETGSTIYWRAKTVVIALGMVAARRVQRAILGCVLAHRLPRDQVNNNCRYCHVGMEIVASRPHIQNNRGRLRVIKIEPAVRRAFD